MRTRIFQDWVTVQLTTVDETHQASVTQDQGDWLDVSSFAAATFWIDVTSMTTTGAGSLVLNLETSPTLDESYFTPCVPAPTLKQTSSPLVVHSLRAPGFAPLARYLRWRVATVGSDGIATWTVTFRVRVAFSLDSFFVPTDLGGCKLWLRSDLGIVPGNMLNTVGQWNDQSGTGNNVSQTGSVEQPAYLSSDPGYNNLPTLGFASSNGQNLGTSAHLGVSQPCTLYVVGESTSGTAQQEVVADFSTNVCIFIATAISFNWSYYAGTTSITSSNATRSKAAFVCVLNGASSALYINSSTAVAAGIANAGSSGFQNNFFVGGQAGGNALNGKVAEVILCAGAHAPAQRAQVVAYLSNRYAPGSWA
jgi:hypothetical protein